MKLSIIDDEKIYEFNIEQISQWAGMNLKTKKYCIDSLFYYFSGYKYPEYEKKYYENILINDEKIGRKYFNIYKISNRNDLLKHIKITKTSMMIEMLKFEINKYENQRNMEIINNVLIQMFEDINEQFVGKLNNIKLDFEQENIWSMVQKSTIKTDDGKAIEELTDYQLIDTFINEIVHMQEITPEKTMVLFENIDFMIDRKEYNNIFFKVNDICDKYSLYFLFSNVLPQYTVVDEKNIEGITIFNECIFSMPSFDHIEKYIDDNYPFQKNFKKSLLKKIENIIGFIGSKYTAEIDEMVIKKLINESLLIKYRYDKPNSLELNYLFD